jgi:hypothetical protein
VGKSLPFFNCFLCLFPSCLYFQTIFSPPPPRALTPPPPPPARLARCAPPTPRDGKGYIPTPSPPPPCSFFTVLQSRGWERCTVSPPSPPPSGPPPLVQCRQRKEAVTVGAIHSHTVHTIQDLRHVYKKTIRRRKD